MQSKKRLPASFFLISENSEGIENIVWEPEVWIEADPIHMIHNGQFFLRYPDEPPDLKKYHKVF